MLHIFLYASCICERSIPHGWYSQWKYRSLSVLSFERFDVSFLFLSIRYFSSSGCLIADGIISLTTWSFFNIGQGV